MAVRRLLAVVLASAALGGCAGSTSGTAGAELYGQVCASCHGADGSGGVGPALGTGSAAEALTDDQIAGAIDVGPGAMPGFGHLSEEQVDSLVAFVRTLQE